MAIFSKLQAKMFFSVVKTFSRGGSKTKSDNGFEVNSKIKTKKIQKRQFLDFAFYLQIYKFS